jgi:hypothetical protein
MEHMGNLICIESTLQKWSKSVRSGEQFSKHPPVPLYWLFVIGIARIDCDIPYFGNFWNGPPNPSNETIWY